MGDEMVINNLGDINPLCDIITEYSLYHFLNLTQFP